MSEDIVKIGEEEISIMDLAGLSMDDVEEYRASATPAGKFLWRVVEAKLEARDATNKDDPQGPKISKPTVNFELESQNCFALVEEKLDPANYIGIKHNETIWISNADKDLGRIKAFLVDIGVGGSGSLTDLLAQAQGIEFVSDVTNVKNKDNPDYVYANLKKPMTVAAFNESQQG